jgi:hypothetical protein
LGLTPAELALEKLWPFLWENFPDERLSLQPAVAPKAVAAVNVTLKLLHPLEPIGNLEVVYTFTGTKRHLRSRDTNAAGKSLTFCGYEAMTLHDIVEKGSITKDQVRTARTAELCGSCRRSFNKQHPVSRDEMSDARKRLTALEDVLAE